MECVPKPRYFAKNRDCNIYKIFVESIVTVTEKGEVTQKFINDPEVEDFWFVVKLHNDGKCAYGKHCKFHEFEYSKWHKNWIKADSKSVYVVHRDFEKYHHVGCWDIRDIIFWPSSKMNFSRVIQGIWQPELGPKNRIKIKTAIRKYLERIVHG